MNYVNICVLEVEVQTQQITESITLSKTNDSAVREGAISMGGGGGGRGGGNMGVQTNTSIELLIKIIALQWKKINNYVTFLLCTIMF